MPIYGLDKNAQDSISFWGGYLKNSSGGVGINLIILLRFFLKKIKISKEREYFQKGVK
jgi:hypothetical protein